MDADAAKTMAWASPTRAFQLLVFSGVIILPAFCGAGHAWGINASNRGYSCMHCRFVLPPEKKDDEEGDGQGDEAKRRDCSHRKTWRQPGTIMKKLPNSLHPVALVKALYYFAEKVSLLQVRKQSGLGEKPVRKLFNILRTMMKSEVQEVQNAQPKLGGRGRAVAIDCTYFTKPKKNRAGFRGRVTAGHKKVVLGMVELDLARQPGEKARKTTGRVRLLEVPGEQKHAIFNAVRNHIVPGSLIFTDKHASYKFLSKLGYIHRCVNHKRREFSRPETVFGQDILVSTNSAEGLFSRLKQFARERGLRRIARDDYGLLLAEFLWRQMHVSPRSDFRNAGLWPLLDMVAKHTSVDFGADVEIFKLDPALEQEFKDWRDSHREMIPLELPLQAAPPVRRVLDLSDDDDIIVVTNLQDAGGLGDVWRRGADARDVRRRQMQPRVPAWLPRFEAAPPAAVPPSEPTSQPHPETAPPVLGPTPRLLPGFPRWAPASSSSDTSATVSMAAPSLTSPTRGSRRAGPAPALAPAASASPATPLAPAASPELAAPLALPAPAAPATPAASEPRLLPTLPVAPGTCPAGHPLRRFVWSKALYEKAGHCICDICRHRVAYRAHVFHCEQCVWDMCSKCARGRL